MDEGKIALRPAVELSYLSKDEQQMVFKQIEICECTPSHAQTIRMRKISQNGGLNAAMIEDIMLEEKPNQREKVSVSYEKVRKYIPESVPFEDTGSYIMDALEFYQKYRSKVSQINNKNKTR